MTEQKYQTTLLNEKKVLMIYVSGAIGAEKQEDQHHKVIRGALIERIKSNYYLCDIEYTNFHAEEGFFITPLSAQNKRIIYQVIEMHPIQNSRQTTYQDVRIIAELIKENYEKYNAFVLFCGIATITYTGSILSFILENMRKPVILTGALVPLSFMRNDAFSNILNSLMLAGHYDIPEVVIVFDSKGYRANRCRQLDCSSFDCIDSPNFPALVNFGINIEIQWQYVLRRGEQVFKQGDEVLKLSENFVTDIIIMKITPFTTIEQLRYTVNMPNLRCLILECYHFGEMPHSPEILQLFIHAQTNLNMIIILITQCVRSNSSREDLTIGQAGVVIRNDITPESASAKIGYLLGKGYSNQVIKEKFHMNLQGEIDSTQQKEKFEGKRQHFIQTLSDLLQKNTGDDQMAQCMEFINQYGIPNLGCYMAKTGKLPLIKEIKQMDGDLNIPDFDGRTILHLAAAEFQADIIEYLILEAKVKINPLDYLGYTPMYDILIQRNKHMLFFFKQNGGIIKAPQDVLVDLILKTGDEGDLHMLECLYYGGLKNLNDYVNIDNRNIAHMAVFGGQLNILKFLKHTAHFDFSARDRWFHQPIDEAIKIKHGQYQIQVEKINEIIELLQSIG